jgi:hypothetical protein
VNVQHSCALLSSSPRNEAKHNMAREFHKPVMDFAGISASGRHPLYPGTVNHDYMPGES